MNTALALLRRDLGLAFGGGRGGPWLPVLFFVDPSIAQDPDAAPVQQITLSYTFHRAPDVPQ